MLGLVLAAAPVAAQDGEFDRRIDPEESSRAGRSVPPPPGEPPSGDTASIDSGSVSARPVPDQGVPDAQRDEHFIPEGVDPSVFPERGDGRAPVPREPPSLWEEVQLDLEGQARAGFGHDTNVFRSERGRRSDGFFHTQGEVELLAEFPQGSEVFVELSGEDQLYFEQRQADEHFAAAFAEYFHPVTSWLDAGIQNTFEFSKQNLLDDNGDLFPRGRFGSIDEEVRPYAVLRPHTDVAFETGLGFRHKDYEENSGVASLDYQELRADASVSYKLSRRPRSRLKLKYRFRRRDYREFRARERDGSPEPGAPRLDLFRHQISLTWYQEVRAAGFEVRLIVSLGLTYNQDLHENDRSYREGSASTRLEWWVVPELTRVDLSLRLVGRNFLVRQPAASGGRLRHRLLDATLAVWQRLGADLPVAVFVAGSTTAWRSGDPREDYERHRVKGGVELFF